MVKGNITIKFRTYTWINNKKYTGNWKEGKMNGEGIMEWKDGTRYEGNYENDKKNGYGTITWRIIRINNVS